MNPQTLAVVLAGISLAISGATFLLVLALLGRKTFQYATKEDLQEVLDRLEIAGKGRVYIWRYLEAIDDRLDLAGLPVLRRGLSRYSAKARD